jgi:hypothetical protein
VVRRQTNLTASPSFTARIESDEMFDRGCLFSLMKPEILSVVALVRFRRWLPPILLLAASCWTGNLAVAYWWAAGGPPTPHPERYAARGNIYFFVTCFFLLTAGFFVWRNLRKRHQP